MVSGHWGGKGVINQLTSRQPASGGGMPARLSFQLWFLFIPLQPPHPNPQPMGIPTCGTGLSALVDPLEMPSLKHSQSCAFLISQVFLNRIKIKHCIPPHFSSRQHPGNKDIHEMQRSIYLSNLFNKDWDAGDIWEVCVCGEGGRGKEGEKPKSKGHVWHW